MVLKLRQNHILKNKNGKTIT